MQIPLAIVTIVAAASAHATEPARPGILGFRPERVEAQRALESRFDAKLDADNLHAWMKRLTSKPHHAGSPGGKENVEFIAAGFREWGYRVEVEEFRVLFPTPRSRTLQLLEPERFTASLEEPSIPEDPSTTRERNWLPGYNAFSVDGDVTGELVYVNQGIPADYEQLARLDIDVRGRVVIARYGGSWRGIKPKVAAEHGAIGCILYSDPRDDGYFQGEVYPKGSFKNEHGVQRGSVADMPLFPGDPLTPGVGSLPSADRLPLDRAPTLTRIPVLPISHADALPLLRALEGAVAPESWRGALPITYRVGPGPATVRLALTFDWNTVSAYNVIATLPGSDRADQWILRGNHHDAWVFGADDPVSGLVAMMEEARVVGELARGDWKPRRSIVYAAWDAEEPGLIGSTEWVETHEEKLHEHAAVYINTDSSGRGFLSAGGSHTLERFFDDVARDVTDPQKDVSVAERALARSLLSRSEEQWRNAPDDRRLRLSALGSGSDYTPFLQHLGIASLNVGYGGENRGGEYHSLYDTFEHYTRFGDPDFAYGVTLARTTGRAVLRLASADVLPFEFTAFAETVAGYTRELEETIESMRARTERENRLIAEGAYEIVADPGEPFVSPQPEQPVPFLNLSPLQNAMASVRRSAEGYVAALAELDPHRVSEETARRIDEILFRAERHLLRDAGLPGRPWFKHQIYAPGFYTGYGVKTLPGAREAIEQRAWCDAEEQIVLLAQTLSGFSEQIDQATALLGAAAASVP